MDMGRGRGLSTFYFVLKEGVTNYFCNVKAKATKKFPQHLTQIFTPLSP
jgi:hypothetical protein